MLQQSTIQRQKYSLCDLRWQSCTPCSPANMNKIHIDCPTTKWSFSHLTAQIFSSSREALLVAERHDRLVTQFAERVRSDFFQNSPGQLHDQRVLAALEDKLRASSMSSPRTQVVRSSLGKLQHYPTPPLAGAPHTALCCPPVTSASAWASANKAGNARVQDVQQRGSQSRSAPEDRDRPTAGARRANFVSALSS